MTFLALILALLIGRFVPLPQALEKHEGFFKWRSKVAVWLKQQPLPPSGRLVFHWIGSVLLPVCVVALLSGVLSDLSWLLSLLFSTAILVVVFGATDGLERIKMYVQAADTKDWQKALSKVDEVPEAKQSLLSLAQGDWQGLHKAAIGAFSYRALTQLFAPVFWLMLLGPAGALVYCWSCLFASATEQPDGVKFQSSIVSGDDSRDENTRGDNARAETALGGAAEPVEGDLWKNLSSLMARIVPFLDWLPVRALGLSLAITGNFSGSIMRWQQHLLHLGQSAADFLLQVVDGSLRMAPAYEREINSNLAEVKELYPLLQRTVYLWVTVIAMIVMFS